MPFTQKATSTKPNVMAALSWHLYFPRNKIAKSLKIFVEIDEIKS
jgi:hypothetical protein